MVVDITSPDVHGLEHFDGGEAKVVGHAGGQTVLDFGYGKTELFPSACCVARGAPGTTKMKTATTTTTTTMRLSPATKRLR